MKKIPAIKNDDDEIVTKGYLRLEMKRFERMFEAILAELKLNREDRRRFALEREQLYSNDIRQEVAIDGLDHRVSKLETQK